MLSYKCARRSLDKAYPTDVDHCCSVTPCTHSWHARLYGPPIGQSITKSFSIFHFHCLFLPRLGIHLSHQGCPSQLISFNHVIPGKPYASNMWAPSHNIQASLRQKFKSSRHSYSGHRRRHQLLVAVTEESGLKLKVWRSGH